MKKTYVPIICESNLTDTKGGETFFCFGRKLKVRWIIWSSIEVHLVDALAAEGDEGRCSLR